ncbi:transcription regulator, SARP family [Kutzneria albida DSM 43870]|uniref:Transcription regulator, SARP family n=2 Tax=Kutzneria TaxID=43356 RepID=W5W267_9PSEU|nr:transcription regulator, SARP family [Kutzneria albida DSM 43870]
MAFTRDVCVSGGSLDCPAPLWHGYRTEWPVRGRMSRVWDFRLLGGLEVVRDGEVVPVPAPKQRVVLGSLLLTPGRVVPAGELVDRLWGEAPPDGARATLRNYVMRLRRALGDTGADLIVTRPEGYLAAVDENQVDLHQFQRSMRRAREFADSGDLDQAGALIETSLGLWRGDPLLDLPSDKLHAEVVPVLVERRLAALELRFDLDLRRGLHQELVGELGELVIAHPLRERFWAQRMLALYRSGRQAEALEEYRALSQVLAEELGIDPSEPVRQLHQQILAGDPKLTLPDKYSATPQHGAPPVPRQLPAAPTWFAGREEELTQLTAAMDDETGMAVIALVGAGGIGKTCLALHWAHRNLHRFPDGQLFVDLRGFSPDGQPMCSATAVRGFLDALGVAAARVPTDPHAGEALLRSLLATRRMLLVLDNAADTAQLVPLLPGGSSCTVLVTSRDQLIGLAAGHNARRLPVEVLTGSEGRTLLASRLGRERVSAEPAAVAQLLLHCAGLPLALTIVAGRAQEHADCPLATVAEELRDATNRLGVLDEGDPAASVRAVLSWSVADLTTDQLTVLSLLALAPGADISLSAAAALTGLPPAQARRCLRTLERVSLLRQQVYGRYRMHDLIRLYAAEQPLQPQQRDEALLRLVEHYTHTAFAADRVLNPHRDPITAVAPADSNDLVDRHTAMTWFEQEHQHLLAAQQLAARQGWHELVWQLAWATDTFHQQRGLRHEELATWLAGATSAQHLGDTAAESTACRFLGSAHARLGSHAEAVTHLGRALALAVQAGDPRLQAHAHHSLAIAEEICGDDHLAREHAVRALEMFQQHGPAVYQARSLSEVGWLSARLGEYDRARSACEDALELFQRHNHRAGQADTQDSLGFIAHSTGRYDDAVHHYEQALGLCRALGFTYGEAQTLERLGHTHTALGNHERARTAWRQAVELYQAQQRSRQVDIVQRELDQLEAVTAVPEPRG